MLESLAILIGIAAIAAKRLSRFPTITELAPPARFEENSRADNSERRNDRILFPTPRWDCLPCTAAWQHAWHMAFPR
jgi:hypothetical protein